LSQLVKTSTDLTEKAQFDYITQTVGSHLENYLKFNRREKDQLDMMLANPKKNNQATKHMEVVSLSVLVALISKNAHLCISAI